MPIWDAVRRTWRQPREVQQAIIQEVKSICAATLDAALTDYDVIFTSNTTEAINLVAESLRNEAEPGSEMVILNTLLEHNSNELPWRMVPGASLIRLPVDAEGFVDFGRAGDPPACLQPGGPARKKAHQAGGGERRFERPRHLQRSGGDQPHRAPLRRAPAGGCGAVGRPSPGQDGRLGHRLSRFLGPQGLRCRSAPAC